MEITLEKIDLLRKRADVTYNEAKEALQKNEGDVVEALAYLEEQNKIKQENKLEVNTSSLWKKLKKLYIKASPIRLRITSKDNNTLLNVGVPLAILITIITMPLAVALFFLALVTNCRIKFIKDNGQEYGINNSLNSIASKTSDLAGKVAQEVKSVWETKKPD